MGLSPDQLKRMQPHIWSEIRAYRTAIKEFAGLKKRAGAEVDLMDRRNRALEATLLHFRILRDFFYKGHGSQLMMSSLSTTRLAGKLKRVKSSKRPNKTLTSGLLISRRNGWCTEIGMNLTKSTELWKRTLKSSYV